MKKVYLHPTIKLVNSNMPLIIATSIEYKGTAGEEHGGGGDGTADHRDNPPIGGTGDDNGFILGSKNRGNVFYE